jgi:hypothetical protein
MIFRACWSSTNGLATPTAARRFFSRNHATDSKQGSCDKTLSNGLQLAPQKGVYAHDLDAELERLYAEHVAPPLKFSRVGAPGSRAMIRSYCSQVWKAAGLWERIRKSMRVAEFTFPGDPMRIDYSYRRNGTRGYVQTRRFSRSWGLQVLRVRRSAHRRWGAFRLRVCGGDRRSAAGGK